MRNQKIGVGVSTCMSISTLDFCVVQNCLELLMCTIYWLSVTVVTISTRLFGGKSCLRIQTCKLVNTKMQLCWCVSLSMTVCKSDRVTIKCGHKHSKVNFTCLQSNPPYRCRFAVCYLHVTCYYNTQFLSVVSAIWPSCILEHASFSLKEYIWHVDNAYTGIIYSLALHYYAFT